MQITYTMQGDYLLPNLTLPEQENREIEIWGQRHKTYLLNHHKVRCYNLLTSCKLTDYLADINEQAENMYQFLVKQLAEKESITEQLKSENPMIWVQQMNNIQNRAREIVNNEIIYILPRIAKEQSTRRYYCFICDYNKISLLFQSFFNLRLYNYVT